MLTRDLFAVANLVVYMYCKRAKSTVQLLTLYHLTVRYRMAERDPPLPTRRGCRCNIQRFHDANRAPC